VHRLLRQLPPPHEFGLERVDWFVGLPPRGPSVPRTPRPEEARPLGRASAFPRFPSPVDDAPDPRHDLGARRPGTAPRDRSRALRRPVLCPRRSHRSRARDPGMGILLRGRLAFPFRPLGGGRARPLPGNCSPVDRAHRTDGPAREASDRSEIRVPVARGILVPAIGILVVLGNARNGLFAGAVGTQFGLLQMLPAIGVLAAFAVGGYQLARRTTNRINDLVVAMLVAPVALILFGLLRGLDPESLLILYRSVDF